MDPSHSPTPANPAATHPRSVLPGKLLLPKVNPEAIRAWAGAIRDLAILFALIPVAWFAFRVAFSQSGIIEDRLIHIVKHGKWELVAFGVKVADVPLEQRQADLQAVSAQADKLRTSLQQGVPQAKLQAEASAIAQNLERLKQEGQHSIQTAVDMLNRQEQRTPPGVSARDRKPLTGWVFLGRVDESAQKNWQPQATTIEPVNYAQLKKGAELVVRDSVFVRGDDGDADRSQRDVIGVAKKGERLRVLDDPFHSKSKLGGNFIWVRVERLQS